MTGFIITAAAFIAAACAILHHRFNAECERDNAMRAYYRAKAKYYQKRGY